MKQIAKRDGALKFIARCSCSEVEGARDEAARSPLEIVKQIAPPGGHAHREPRAVRAVQRGGTATSTTTAGRQTGEYKSTGIIESYPMDAALVSVMQTTLVAVVTEKEAKLVESMKRDGPQRRHVLVRRVRERRRACAGALCALILRSDRRARAISTLARTRPMTRASRTGSCSSSSCGSTDGERMFTFVPAAIFRPRWLTSVFSGVWQVGATVIHHVNKPFKRPLSMQLWAARCRSSRSTSASSRGSTPRERVRLRREAQGGMARDRRRAGRRMILRKGRKNACDDQPVRAPAEQAGRERRALHPHQQRSADDGGEGYAFGGVA